MLFSTRSSVNKTSTPTALEVNTDRDWWVTFRAKERVDLRAQIPLASQKTRRLKQPYYDENAKTNRENRSDAVGRDLFFRVPTWLLQVRFLPSHAPGGPPSDDVGGRR